MRNLYKISALFICLSLLNACTVDEVVNTNDYYSGSGYVKTYHDNNVTSGYNRDYNPPRSHPNSGYYSDNHSQAKQPTRKYQKPPNKEEYYSDQTPSPQDDGYYSHNNEEGYDGGYSSR